jgi:hypothetical protein
MLMVPYGQRSAQAPQPMQFSVMILISPLGKRAMPFTLHKRQAGSSQWRHALGNR